MRIVRFLLFLFPAACCLLPAVSKGQSEIIRFARTVIDTLASPSMHGRGYVNKGDSLAADYLKKEFIRLGLQPAGKNFYQYFDFPVTAFPGRMEVKIGDQLLVAGKDYIVNNTHPFFPDENLKVKYSLKGNNEKVRSCDYFWIIDTLGNPSWEKCIRAKDCFIFSGDMQEKLTAGFEKAAYEEERCKRLNILTFRRGAVKNRDENISIRIESRFYPQYTSQNVIGMVRGTEQPDSFLVFTAHYDHLGQMGSDVYFPGANDNASGCAMLLTLAKYYAQHPTKYSIAFIAFGAEEAGLIGSKYFSENPLFPLKSIRFLVNMDIMGTGDEGIKVVNATEHKKEFDALVKINAEKKLVPSVQPRGKAANSDHYFFEEAGVKTFFIYTLGGIKAYHDIYDRPETLPLTKFEDIFTLLTEFVKTID